MKKNNIAFEVVLFALQWSPMVIGACHWGVPGFFGGFMVFALCCLLYSYYQSKQPQQVQFNDVARFASKYSELPQGFNAAWAWVEKNRATKEVCYTAADPCDICGRQGDENYKADYVYNGYKWTGMDREHKMHRHVEYGCDHHGYWLPEPAFLRMVISVYKAHCLNKAQTA
ncbi:MAG: hypothetical protein ACI9TY_000439 [Alphaproteobacteria bacterium]|jgi:hypothetical protein